MKRPIWLIVLVLTLLNISVAEEDQDFSKHREAYPGPVVNSDPEHIAATHRDLLQIMVSDDPLDADTVPEPAIPLLTILKHQIRQLIGVTIFSQPTAVSADQLHQKLVVSLQQSDIIVGYNESGSDEGLYGVVEELSVKAPEGHSNMLVVQVKYAVACGSDSTLYVFEHTGTQWRMRIALEQNDYEAVAGALGFFDYVISPPDEQGNWYLLYATIGNWCTSNWHGITYRVITPGEDAYSPRTVFSDGDGVYIGEDNVYKLTANRNDFQVSYRSNHQLDSGLLIRTHVHHYTFSPKLERIAPLAMSPNGFLDEWIHLAWPEAEKWTRNPTNYVHRLHDLLQKAELGGEIELEQPCTNSKSWLIGLADEDLTLYANVELLGNDYYLRGLSFRRPRGCPGTTRPEQETDELP